MTAFTSLLEGLQQVFTLEAMCYLLAGVFIGNVAGLLPGLGATSGTAILLPLTFGMDAVDSLVMLAGIYYGTMYGGTISAILINVPGTTAAAMSSLDGYPLTRRGKGGKALCVATFSCFVGGLIGTLGLTFGGSTLAQVALKFGAPEMFALTLMGLCLVTGITGDYPLKGYLMLIFGLLLGTIGIDTITGQQRFTFNFIYLLDGLNTIPVLVLPRALLQQLPPGALVVDLASEPGGVDFTAAQALGVQAVQALALPGRCAPYTAGELIGQAVLAILADRGEQP